MRVSASATRASVFCSASAYSRSARFAHRCLTFLERLGDQLLNKGTEGLIHSGSHAIIERHVELFSTPGAGSLRDGGSGWECALSSSDCGHYRGRPGREVKVRSLLKRLSVKRFR